jgi:hypothetical protein
VHASGSGSGPTSGRRLLLLFVGVVLLHAPGLLLGPPGAKGMGGGLRVLAGEVPYRDFWTMYAPGQFYAHALLFRLFGVAWLPQGVATILLNAGSAVLFHRLLERLGVGSRLRLVLFAVFALAFWRVAPDLDSYPPALFLGLVGLERVVAAHGSGEARPLLVAGLAFGAAAWFKHDVAAYFAAAATGSLAFAPLPGRAVARSIARLALGCAVTALPVVLWLALTAGQAAWRDLVVFPATDFRLVRSETYPSPLLELAPFERLIDAMTGAATWEERMSAWRDAGGVLRGWSLTQLPILVFAVACVTVVLRRRTLEPLARAAAVLCLCGMPLFFLAAHVQQNTHLDSMAILALVLMALAWRSPGPGVRGVLALGILLYAGSFLLEAGMRAGQFAAEYGAARRVDARVTNGIALPRRYAEPYEAITAFLRANTAPDERIHAGVDRHDAVVGNDQNFYVLAERLPATRFGELHPGVVDRTAAQREMIADLERHGVRCVLVWHFRFGDPEERIAHRRTAFPDAGATLLDEYVEREFEEVARFGQHSIRWRRGEPRPSIPTGGGD